MKITATTSKPTARQNLVTVLAQEILSGTYDPKFPIPSEHQLCRRFGVSRVTVRLALSDLQNRGLIYRHHGKGTFIHHGSGKTIGKPLAILAKFPEHSACPAMAALLRGFQSYLAEGEAYSVTIGINPAQWSPAMASSLGGVLVMPEGVTATDLDNLHKRNLPYLLLGVSDLPGPSLRLGTELSAYEAVLTLASRGIKSFGFLHGNESPHDALKLQGITKALMQAGLGSSNLEDVACRSTCEDISHAVEGLLDRTPAPEVILTSELTHTLALLGAVRERNLSLGRDIQVISFGNPVAGQSHEPGLHVIELPFFEGGRKAAEALCRASLSAVPLESISLPHRIHWSAV